MKKILVMVLTFVFVFYFTGATVLANEAVIVKSGTVIPVSVKSVQNSKTVKSGDKIECLIAQDIVINDIVVFKKGGRATLNVSNAKKAGFVGIPGELVIAGGEVYDVNNNEHLVTFNRTITGEEKTWPKVCLGCGLLIILAPIALFGFVKGGQAELNPATSIDVNLSQDFKF